VIAAALWSVWWEGTFIGRGRVTRRRCAGAPRGCGRWQGDGSSRDDVGHDDQYPINVGHIGDSMKRMVHQIQLEKLNQSHNILLKLKRILITYLSSEWDMGVEGRGRGWS